MYKMEEYRIDKTAEWRKYIPTHEGNSPSLNHFNLRRIFVRDEEGRKAEKVKVKLERRAEDKENE